MFSMSLGNHAGRGLAAAALILSLTATTFASSANAAPLANTQACKVASQARNDAMSALRDAWKASSSDLKALSKGTPELRHELMSAWRDLRSVLMQAVQDLKDLGLGSACQHENEDGAPTMGAATTADTTAVDAKVKAVIDQAIKDLQAVVDAARKSVADQTAAGAPKDSTASDEPKDSTAAAEPKDSTDGANSDKDSHEGNQGTDEDATANNEQKSEDSDNHQTSAKSKAKSTSVDKANSLKKSTNLGKMKTGHGANQHERD